MDEDTGQRTKLTGVIGKVIGIMPHSSRQLDVCDMVGVEIVAIDMGYAPLSGGGSLHNPMVLCKRSSGSEWWYLTPEALNLLNHRGNHTARRYCEICRDILDNDRYDFSGV